MPERAYYLPDRRLVSQDDASIVEAANVPRSRFIGSWTRKTTLDAGFLVPFLCDEVLPGDHLSYDVTAYVRMATPLFPIFDNQRVDTFFFFIPNRLVWDNWTAFMGEQVNPDTDIESLLVPTLTSPEGGYPSNSIFDQFALPVVGQIGAENTFSHNVLPLRGYNLVFNQWFRDQNLVDSLPVSMGDSGDSVSDFSLQRRAKFHDYFTSALPWPQKFEAPSVPVAGNAPVLGIGTYNGVAPEGDVPVRESDGTTSIYEFAKLIRGDASNDYVTYVDMTAATNAFPQIYADLSQATGVAINTFRQAFLVQQLLERDARGGTRYVELLKSHFGVTNPDFRLQRPEYIGGGQSPLIITPVAQTAPNAGGGGVGVLGGAGTASGGHRASYAATEHGFVLGLINLRTELSYSQGLNRQWSRSTRYDYYWPSLAGLGEQAILRKELFITGNGESDNVVFGYQERWHEYRQRQSEVTGLFRPYVADNIAEWHLSQEFESAPVLSEEFIEDDPPMARVLAAGALSVNQQYLADIMISRTAVRALPTFGTPVLLGRF